MSDSVKPKQSSLLRTFLFHFRPRFVPAPMIRFTLSFGLGGMAAVLVFLLLLSGILLKFVYEPSPAGAYASIILIQDDIVFGRFIRNIHHWSAHLLVLVLFFHILRVFFSGAFHQPRRLNWIVGLCLFALVLASNFTGYLLPWDQLSYWAVTISIGMLDYMPVFGPWLQGVLKQGAEIGPETLHFFYTAHTVVLPAVLLFLAMFHFWRVRKAGGLAIPRETGGGAGYSRVPVMPDLLIRELTVGLSVTAFIMMAAAFFDAPLGLPANPGLSPNPTKAPWYFSGLQELLLHFHPVMAAAIIPTLAALCLLLLPFFKYQTNPSGVWFVSATGRNTSVIAALLSLFITPAVVILDEYSASAVGGTPPAISSGLFLLVLVVLGAAVILWLLHKKYSLSKLEAVQFAFTFFITSFVVLTIIGVWFRGPGMVLSWP